MYSWTHLHRADHPIWHQEPDYNPDVTTHLAAAYATIQRVPDRIASFREAGYQVVAFGDIPMCRQQRMNVCYLMGMAHAADDEYPQAMPWLDRAVALARELDDGTAQADLLFLRGPVAQRMDLYARALDDYCVALHLHRTQEPDLGLGREPSVLDRGQELYLFVWAAGYALTQEEFALTRRLLCAARRVARGVVVAPPGIIAQHDWFWAAYVDACGYPERALQTALRAGAMAAQDGSESYVVLRIYAFAARLTADLAATHEEGSVGRTVYLDMAARCLRAARRALAPNDRAGKGFIQMRQARLDSLRHRTARALDRIGAAERLAREIDDGPLLVQALTVHGQIRAERREDGETALHLYRQAQAIAVERGIPYAALPARRALRRLEELLPGEER